jgi:predicted nucleic acid-binding protein
MLALFDTTTFTLLLKPEVEPPNDPRTGKPVHRAADRVVLLSNQLKASNSRLLIPATVWAEFLVAADSAAQEYLEVTKKKSSIEIVPFDAIAAVEAAIDQRNALKAGNSKIKFDGSRQCVKADRQIMAVAKTKSVDMVFTSDRDLVLIGASMGVPVTALWDMPLPPSDTPLLDAADDEEAK